VNNKATFTLLTVGLTMALGAACSGTGNSDEDDGSGPSGTTATTTGTGGSGGTTTPASSGALMTGPGGAGQGGDSGTGGGCVDIEVDADAVLAPADVIIIFDTSGSMSDEAQAVEDNINASFATILSNSGLDYQVVVVADYGTGTTDLCIQPPLSGAAGCAGTPAEVAGQFYHYHDQGDGVGITPDSFLEALPPHAGDDDGNHTAGLLPLLRTDSIKHILWVSDDDPQGSNWGTTEDPLLSGPTGDNARDFYTTLLNTSPTHFGDQFNPRVVFHSIVGIVPKANPNDAYLSTELVSTAQGNAVHDTKCTSAVDTGVWYQMLSVGTGGLRYPVCNTNSYDAVFQQIATGVLAGAALPCEFALPDVKPEGFDEEKLEITFTPGSGPTETFNYVSSAGACSGGDDFYVDNDTIFLCPAACDKVEVDPDGAIDITAKCVDIPD